MATKRKRQTISKTTRFEVFKRDSFTCQYCGKSAPTVILHIDHIQPVSKDGDNDILNLITACDDCNLGKSDRLISDHSIIAKQKAQLDEINERREQLELMNQWRKHLQSIDETELSIAADHWTHITVHYSLNDNGRNKTRQLLQKFSLEEVIEGMNAVTRYFVFDDNTGHATAHSMDYAFNRIIGVCRTKRQPDWKQELYYIRGILRNRITFCDDVQALRFLQDAHIKGGISLDALRDFVLQVNNWTEFRQAFESREW